VQVATEKTCAHMHQLNQLFGHFSFDKRVENGAVASAACSPVQVVVVFLHMGW